MNIYFSGIGGVGIGPLAQIALDAGYNVQGSDAQSSLMTAQLQDRGVTIAIDQDGTFLRTCHRNTPIDLFVYTAALAANHPELLVARELGIACVKRDELLARIIADKQLKLIAVAGTHGKTTTTGMLVWTMLQLGIPVSYSIGTTISFGPSGRYDPTSEYFVYECDEFDKNFLQFQPYLSLITSFDYDHPDTYPSEADYAAAFQQFLHQSVSSLLWQTDADAIGAQEEDAWCLQEEEVRDIRLAGEHNRRNGTLVLKAIERLGLGENLATLDALETFPGTTRRFEKLYENLYSDYGHHPVEIAATLQLAREISEHVILVYQPHQNVRQHEIYDQYSDEVFHNAEQLYWLPTYLSREDPELEILQPAELTKHLDASKLHFAQLDEKLLAEIQQHNQQGHIVVCMGAGSIDGWIRKQLT